MDAAAATSFAHSSERQLALLLDFYEVVEKWLQRKIFRDEEEEAGYH